MERNQAGFSTRALHAGQDADPATGATIVPIYATSTYTQAAPDRHKGYEYSRTGNPTRHALETCLAALEGADAGLAFGSGSAATAGVLTTLRPGQSVADQTIAGYNIRSWSDGNFTYVAVSDLPVADLKAFENAFSAASPAPEIK